MSSTDDLISAKELASKLKVTEPLLKKLIKDFGIETTRQDRRLHLDEKSSTTVREILALRASGKKNSEIKEMFEASKKPAEPTKAKEEKPEEKVTAQVASEEDKANTEEKANKTTKKKTVKKKTDAKKTKKKTKKAEESEEKSDKESAEELKIEATIDEDSTEDDNADNEADDDSVIDISSYLHEDEEEDDELRSLLSVEEGDEEISDIDDEDDIEEVDEIDEATDDKLSPRKIRRRQFSFKYIQRQIANDSKRVNYIKQKLKRGRISTKEKMMLEDSLNHRSVLLSGWVQLLRWVKN